MNYFHINIDNREKTTPLICKPLGFEVLSVLFLFSFPFFFLLLFVGFFFFFLPPFFPPGFFCFGFLKQVFKV